MLVASAFGIESVTTNDGDGLIISVSCHFLPNSKQKKKKQFAMDRILEVFPILKRTPRYSIVLPRLSFSSDDSVSQRHLLIIHEVFRRKSIFHPINPWSQIITRKDRNLYESHRRCSGLYRLC